MQKTAPTRYSHVELWTTETFFVFNVTLVNVKKRLSQELLLNEEVRKKFQMKSIRCLIDACNAHSRSLTCNYLFICYKLVLTFIIMK